MRARSESSSRSSSRAITNRDRVRCFKCKEYDHFVNKCPNLVPNDSDRESDGARSTSLQILADSDTGSDGRTIFKHLKGRNGSTSFLPLKKKGGLNNKVISETCLIEEQAQYIYDKIESGDKLKAGKTTLQIQNNSFLPKQVKERKDINLYEKVLISNMNIIKNKLQMEQWSILSDNIVYIRSEGNDVMIGVNIKMVDYRDHRRMYRRMGKKKEEY